MNIVLDIWLICFVLVYIGINAVKYLIVAPRMRKRLIERLRREREARLYTYREERTQ